MTTVFQRLTGLTLLDPGLLWFALLIPALLWWRRRGGERSVLFAPAWLWTGEKMPRSWRVAFLPLPRDLQILGLLCLIVAFARPAEKVRLPDETQGIDILLCLDTSSSMTANDMDRRRTRLKVAREAAAEFVRGRPDDRIGLITFARFPDLACPLTRDHAALLNFLSDVVTVTSEGPEDATGIGAAVARAAQVLQGGDAARSRVVILLTDGEENVALTGMDTEIPPIHAAQLCERLGIRVYAIAAGVARPGPGGTQIRLDTRPVELLAQRTGGTFHRVQNAGAVSAVYDRIDRLERAPVEEPRYRMELRFLPFLLAGLFLVLLGALLAATVFEVLP